MFRELVPFGLLKGMYMHRNFDYHTGLTVYITIRIVNIYRDHQEVHGETAFVRIGVNEDKGRREGIRRHTPGDCILEH